jgi:quaternary ammonium compound-resistance protein SugE
VAWLVLIISGFLEAGWAVSLKQSAGLSRLWPTVSFVIFAALSLAGLAWSLKHLPVGPAYAVWTGIGAAVTVIIGIVFLNEAVSVLKIVSVGLIIAGVAGLNISTGGH